MKTIAIYDRNSYTDFTNQWMQKFITTDNKEAAEYIKKHEFICAPIKIVYDEKYYENGERKIYEKQGRVWKRIEPVY